MRFLYLVSIFFLLCSGNALSENYNFHNSISTVSSINNSKFKTSKVNKYINYFSKNEKGRVFFKMAYRRQGYFKDVIYSIFKEYDIPKDLIYLSMIESGFQVNISSNAGAVGLWQFMPSTGRIFDLRVDKWVDERRDFVKSTYAAAQYLRSLKGKFGSWELAMAGYNSGDLTVKRAIKEHKSRDFWYLSQHTFPKQTREYVPQILAVIYISKNMDKFGFSNKKIQPRMKMEKVKLPPHTSLEYVSKISDIDITLLKEINSSLLRDITPPDGPYSIYVPLGLKETVYAKLASSPESKVISKYKVKKGDTLGSIGEIYSNSVEEILKLNNMQSTTIYSGQEILVYKKIFRNDNSKEPESFVYLVKKGDSLSLIAEKFSITKKDLKRANNLVSNKIEVGQSLKIIKSNE